jgi:hypothetical protein
MVPESSWRLFQCDSETVEAEDEAYSYIIHAQFSNDDHTHTHTHTQRERERDTHTHTQTNKHTNKHTNTHLQRRPHKPILRVAAPRANSNVHSCNHSKRWPAIGARSRLLRKEHNLHVSYAFMHACVSFASRFSSAPQRPAKFLCTNHMRACQNEHVAHIDICTFLSTNSSTCMSRR